MDFINEIFCLANFAPTFMLGFMLLYWSLVIVGGIGMDAIDLDIDSDVGVDLDLDGDIDVETGGAGVFASLAAFLHLGDVPVTIVLTFFTLFWWTGTVVTNHIFNPSLSILISAVVMVPWAVVSIVMTRLAAYPFAIMLRNRDTYEDKRERMVGKVGLVKTSEVNDDFGQIEVAQDGPPITMNARTRPGVRLGKGDAAKIISYNEHANTYLVELSKWESN